MSVTPEQSFSPTEFADGGLPPETVALLRPAEVLPDGSVNPAFEPYQFQARRLQALPGFDDIQQRLVDRRVGGSLETEPYMTPEGIEQIWANTQGPDETHRILTPRIQEILAGDGTRRAFFEGIDTAARNDTEQFIEQARRQNGVVECDIALIGTGPHSAAAAAMLRHQYPGLRIVMIERGTRPGGQWRNNGDQVSFFANSRVRAANNALPNIPRTPGNINPQGRWATVELSDIVRGNYATNLEMGIPAVIDGYLNADQVLVGTTATEITDYGDYADIPLRLPDGSRATLSACMAIEAPGLTQISTLNPTSDQRASGRYLNTQDLYRLFGNYDQDPRHRPLAQFAGQTILGVGAGDGLLTGIEALAGNLPAASYGPYGVGRDRVGQYVWIGAPGQYAADIARCLRSRYQNGIVQALPKQAGDQGAFIDPVQARARSFELTGDGVAVTLDNGQVLTGDVIMDHTNTPAAFYGVPIREARRTPTQRSAVIQVGPGARPQLPPEILRVIADLGIGENTVALWATMAITDERAQEAGLRAVRNRALRRRLQTR